MSWMTPARRGLLRRPLGRSVERPPTDMRLWAIILVGVLVVVAALPVPAQAAVSPSPFEVRRDGNTYHAESQTTPSSYSGDLKDVVESATAELMSHGGGVVTFLAGDFDLGPDWFELTEIADITFEGQGIEMTTIRNNASASTDTEPFDMTRSDRITVRDMTVHADGPPRNTSDALDFDGGDDVVIERVKVTGARGRGIIFDGKDAGQTATNNVVRDCIVTGVPADGIQLLASSNNLVENCTITDVGGMGVRVTKSSTSADQPNKKSNDNTIANNVIELSGSHGIGVRASDRNLITGNTVLNAQNGNSGILIAEANNIDCDDNIVQFNTATDDQPAPTQEFGLNIAHSSCHRTVVIDNNFTGNLLGEINDDGTDTIYTSADTEPPSAPGSLLATSVSGVTVDMAWTASTDNIAVAAYDVYRDGELLDSVSGTATAYQDGTVAPLTSYQYVVRARDPAGNVSGPSNALDVTTGAPPPIFTLNPTDDATIRPNKGVLGAAPTLEVDASSVKDAVLRFDVNAVGTSSVLNATLRLHALDGSSSGGTFVQMTNTNWSEDTITWENAPPGDGIPLGSLGAVSAGNWYELDVTPLVTADGPVAVRISSPSANGVDYASKEGAPGLAAELVIELDEAPPSDTEKPSAPTNLVATDLQPTSVSMGWDASSDNVGVVGYDIYRDGGLLDSVDGATTSYQDDSVAPESSYAYFVVARDAAGNPSAASNTLDVVTPAQPQEFALSPTDDATIRPSRPDRNYGSNPALEVDASSKKDILMRFDVTGIGTATVTSATLRLYVVDGSSNGGDWTSTTDTNWSESTVTWNTAPAADGSFLGSLGVVSPGTWVEIDLTTLISEDGVISVRGSSLSANGADYASKEDPAGFAPELVIVLG
ncbi:MAG: DNRLRE domain-containing protein [Thermoleophilia bacterium]|nr:DNRLRE domain-containing protein [Thermoleophilia bacterium]